MHEMTNSEYYDEIAAIMDVCGGPAHACYLQGHWCGMAIGIEVSEQAWIRLFADEFLPGQSLPMEDQQIIAQMIDWTRAAINSSDYDFQLMFPDDDIEFKYRADALIEWLEGFLAGFGLNSIEDDHLDAHSREILQDLICISQLDADLNESESGERELMELYEYVRLCVLTLFEHFADKRVPLGMALQSASVH